MANRLNELYQMLLTNLWDINRINNLINQLIQALRSDVNNAETLRNLMENSATVEELIRLIDVHFLTMRFESLQFNQLKRAIEGYYSGENQ